MNRISSRGLVARASIAGLTLVAVLGALTGCVSAPSSAEREAAANPDMPTICFRSHGDGSIEVEWNLGRSDAEVRLIGPQQSWCPEKTSTGFINSSRAGISWLDGSEQLIVEAGTGFQGLFARYLDNKNGISNWVNMPFSDEDGDGGVNRIGDHRIITHSWKQGTKEKFVSFNVSTF